MDLESVDNFGSYSRIRITHSVIVTHDFNQIDHFFTKVLILKDGIITAMNQWSPSMILAGQVRTVITVRNRNGGLKL